MNTNTERTMARLVAGPLAAAGIILGTHMAPLPQMQSGAYATTQGHQDAPHVTANPHAAAKITNVQEATS